MRDLEGRASGPDLEPSRCGGVLVSLGARLVGYGY